MAIDRTDKAQIGRMKFLEKKRQADQKAQDRKRNIERLKYPARRTIGGRQAQEVREAVIEAIIQEVMDDTYKPDMRTKKQKEHEQLHFSAKKSILKGTGKLDSMSAREYSAKYSKRGKPNRLRATMRKQGKGKGVSGVYKGSR